MVPTEPGEGRESLVSGRISVPAAFEDSAEIAETRVLVRSFAEFNETAVHRIRTA
jgi:hypothetical protein